MGHDVCVPREVNIMRSAGDTATEKNEKSLGELLIIVGMLGILMAIFIYYFLSQEGRFTAAGFGALKNTFSSRINIVHAQWIMDLKPDVVYEKEYKVNSEKVETRRISVNGGGWIDTQNNGNACQEIWYLTMEVPMELMNSPISSVEIKREGLGRNRICRYELPSGEHFKYDTNTGKVSDILL